MLLHRMDKKSFFDTNKKFNKIHGKKTKNQLPKMNNMEKCIGLHLWGKWLEIFFRWILIVLCFLDLMVDVLKGFIVGCLEMCFCSAEFVFLQQEG